MAKKSDYDRGWFDCYKQMKAVVVEASKTMLEIRQARAAAGGNGVDENDSHSSSVAPKRRGRPRAEDRA